MLKIPLMITSQSGLPTGDPAGRGISLSPDIPGTSTYAKPSGEAPREPTVEDSSMYKVDNADNLLKSPTRQDEIDHSKAKPTYMRPGPHPGPGVTKYPYRDNIPNRHNASLIESVVQGYLLKIAQEIPVSFDFLKEAAKISEIESGTNPKVLARSKQCNVTVKRADIPNLRWIFSVDAGNGPKLVKLKATRKGTAVALAKMDVSFTCSCKAWRWLGSEYHAKKEKYMVDKPIGTASTPDIKDPLRINRVCKHVAAVIGQVRDWTLPSKPKIKIEK